MLYSQIKRQLIKLILKNWCPLGLVCRACYDFLSAGLIILLYFFNSANESCLMSILQVGLYLVLYYFMWNICILSTTKFHWCITVPPRYEHPTYEHSQINRWPMSINVDIKCRTEFACSAIIGSFAWHTKLQHGNLKHAIFIGSKFWKNSVATND